jgi:hypothetical protein
MDRSKDRRFNALNEWFADEIYRINRLSEIRREAWWFKVVTACDNEGQTPLHYLAANESEKVAELLKVVMRTGRGNFSTHHPESLTSSGKQEKKRKDHQAHLSTGTKFACTDDSDVTMFKNETLYNTSTGHEVGSVNGPGSLLAGLSNIAESKSPVLDNYLADEKLELTGLLGSKDNDVYLNYEIIIPWLLRNMRKRASDLAIKEQPTDLLRVMTEDIAGDDSFVLIPPEFKNLLAKLGIKVTTDVIREVCRMYPGESDIVKHKWVKFYSKSMWTSDAKQSVDTNYLSDSKGSKGDEDKLVTEYNRSNSINCSSDILLGDEDDLGVDMRR